MSDVSNSQVAMEYKEIQYLMTSEQLLDPETGAVQIGILEAGQYQELHKRMLEEAKRLGISKPLMIVDLIFKEDKHSDLGSTGAPYPINDFDWEDFAQDVHDWFDIVPKVYMVDGSRFTAIL